MRAQVFDFRLYFQKAVNYLLLKCSKLVFHNIFIYLENGNSARLYVLSHATDNDSRKI
jgi:hypothetical protein